MLIVDREKANRREVLWSLAGVGGCACMGAAGCVYNEATGRRQLNLVPDDQLESLSAEAWNEVRRRERVSRSPTAQARVAEVGRRVVRATGGVPNAWEYVAFESDQLNAFALPGGRIGVYTGLLDLTGGDDSELATVMGHEVAHVYARHSAERTSAQLLAQGIPILASVALTFSNVDQPELIVAALGAGVAVGVLLPFNRNQELEADKLGVRYMHQANYDLDAAAEFWRKMQAAAGPSRQPAFLSTHPSPGSRIERIEAEAARLRA